MDEHRLICMMGLPRSGKTTIARALGYPIVNRDSIRLALHGKRFQKEAEPMVKAIAIVMVRALFRAGHTTVIVDETNTTRARRDFWCDKAWTTEFLHVPTPPEECRLRAKQCGQEDLMPIIDSMWAQQEALQTDEERYENRS